MHNHIATGEADLTAVSMASYEEIDAPIFGDPLSLRGV
jgi:hypothetical protein